MRLAAAVLIALLLVPVAVARGDAVIDAANAERARRNLPALIVSARLEHSSTAHARQLMREQRFDHDPMRPAGFGRFAEALLLDYTPHASASAAVEAWMDSPEHRELVLTRTMRYAGAGVSRGDFEGERATLRVLQVGRPQGAR